jgi:hypothetical protein
MGAAVETNGSEQHVTAHGTKHSTQFKFADASQNGRHNFCLSARLSVKCKYRAQVRRHDVE